MATSIPMGIVSLKAEGAYAEDKLYKKGMWVTSSGSSYAYINPTPAAGVPITDTSHWQQIASVGGQDLVDAAVAARDAAQGYKDAAAASAAQLAAGVASPAGTYATTAALASANPDHSKIYVVTANGHWYYWSGAAWADGGLYQAVTPISGLRAFVCGSGYSIDWTANKLYMYSEDLPNNLLSVRISATEKWVVSTVDGLVELNLTGGNMGPSALGVILFNSVSCTFSVSSTGYFEANPNYILVGWFHLLQKSSFISGLPLIREGVLQVGAISSDGYLEFDMTAKTLTIPKTCRIFYGATYYNSYLDNPIVLTFPSSVNWMQLCFNTTTKTFIISSAVSGVMLDAEVMIGAWSGNDGLVYWMNGAYIGAKGAYQQFDQHPYNLDTVTILKIKEFSALFNDSDNSESFVFFTDPHLVDGSKYDTNLGDYISKLKKTVSMAPVSFVACGGDWLTSGDTQEIACYKLGYIDGIMRETFRDYHLVLGNHDTNYQGVDETLVANSGELESSAIRNLWYRDTKSAYYSFDGQNTKFYVLDCGLDWGGEIMNSRKWEQVDWLAEKLLSDDAEHSAIFMHMYRHAEATASAFSTNIGALCSAYNSHSTVTLNGETYDFSSCTGKMEFWMAGHSHSDFNATQNSIPVIETINFKAGGVPSYDLVFVDYDARQIKMTRIGTGSNRTVALA